MAWLIVFPVLAALGLFLYWQLIIAEGAYLGRKVVALLYDWSAHIYDRIKGYDPGYEQWFLGVPLSRALAFHAEPLILDVATGTARLARTLFAQAGFRGRLIGLDYSRKMLREAAKTTALWAEQLTFIWRDASQLPFPDNIFDAVSCLEALEFMPQPEGVIAEMTRVLRPGGVLLTTNRISKDARLLPGRTYSSADFTELLHRAGLEMVQVKPWQEDYDLVWAVKSGALGLVGRRQLEDILRCARCAGPLRQEGAAYICPQGHRHPLSDEGIILMG